MVGNRFVELEYRYDKAGKQPIGAAAAKRAVIRLATRVASALRRSAD